MTTAKKPPTLVVLQLTGGNDVLNTVVPYTDGRYYDNRKRVRIEPEAVLPIDDRYGFHPSLAAIKPFWDAGQMAIVLVVWWAFHRESFPAPWSPAGDATGAGTWPILSILALGILGTGLAYLFQFDVFRAVGQQVGSLVTYLIPIVSVGLGYAFLGERLGPWQVLDHAVTSIRVRTPTGERTIDLEVALRAPRLEH